MRKGKILLIEDTAILAQSISDLLQMEGFIVHVRSNGQQAFRFLNEETVDLIVTDLRMPDMDGLEITRTARTMERLRTIPVIILTADTSPENEKQCSEAGANLLLHKPFDEDIFLECIQRIIRKDDQ